ncbi:hypothetical protein ACEPAI_5086 [Sanghuangporus weigelae]
MDQREADAFDHEMMSLALEEARKCEPKPTAFSVGCVLVARPPDASPFILARSYSRELEGNTHAEANALAKARGLSTDQKLQLLSSAAGYSRGEAELDTDALLRMVDVYTTMEPCSVRTSGLAPCADALIDAGVARCIIGVGEPNDFVKCEGAKRLTDAGIKVIWLKGIERECLGVARMGHSSTHESSTS